MENCHTWIIISKWQNDLHTNTSRSVWPILYGLMIKMLQYKMYPAGELAVLRQLLFLFAVMTCTTAVNFFFCRSKLWKTKNTFCYFDLEDGETGTLWKNFGRHDVPALYPYSRTNDASTNGTDLCWETMAQLLLLYRGRDLFDHPSCSLLQSWIFWRTCLPLNPCPAEPGYTLPLQTV